jgi:hypothetical protein
MAKHLVNCLSCSVQGELSSHTFIFRCSVMDIVVDTSAV